jgi:hypothetical protein
MQVSFYDLAIRQVSKFPFANQFKVDLSQSILHDRLYDQLLVMISKDIRIGITIEKAQVVLQISPLTHAEWFDVEMLISYILKNNDCQVFIRPQERITIELIEKRLGVLLAMFQNHYDQITKILTEDQDFENKINNLRQFRNKLWEEQTNKRKKLWFWQRD